MTSLSGSLVESAREASILSAYVFCGHVTTVWRLKDKLLVKYASQIIILFLPEPKNNPNAVIASWGPHPKGGEAAYYKLLIILLSIILLSHTKNVGAEDSRGPPADG